MQLTHRVSRAGQITLIALLLGVLGLTIGLSLASRSLSDLRQATNVDVGTKTLAAAESALEYGINQLINMSNPPSSNCLGDTDALRFLPNLGASYGISSLTYDICPNGKAYAERLGVGQDDVFQIVLDRGGPGGTFDVLWKGNASVEVIVLYDDFTIRRYAYNATARSNNFTSNYSASPDCLRNGCADNSYVNCSRRNPPQVVNGPGTRPILVRVKPLYRSTDIAVCRRNPGGNLHAIDVQEYIVTAKATSTNGTIKKVQVTRAANGALPSVFDNVIFSGGNLAK